MDQSSSVVVLEALERKAGKVCDWKTEIEGGSKNVARMALSGRGDGPGDGRTDEQRNRGTCSTPFLTSRWSAPIEDCKDT